MNPDDAIEGVDVFSRSRETETNRAGTPDEEGVNPWRVISTRPVYDNHWISVREDSVVRPDGEAGIYGVVHFKNVAVGVLAVEDEHLYLVGQFRYPLGEYSWEIPEGGCGEGEDPLSAARRELAEETGLSARRWEKMGEAHLSNSTTDELAVWYLATDLAQGESRPDGTERLSVKRVRLEEALNMCLTGAITDAISKMAVMQYALGRRSI